MEDSTDKTASCFVVIASDAESDNLWNALIRPAIQQAGMDPQRVADMVVSADVVDESIHMMLSAKVVVAVATRTKSYILDRLIKLIHPLKNIIIIREKGGKQPIGEHYHCPFLEYDPQDFPKSRDALTAALVHVYAQESVEISQFDASVTFLMIKSERLMLDQFKLLALIQHPSPTVWKDRGLHPLPLTLQQIHIKKFQCIKSTGIDSLPPDAPWIFITGDNGDGKTSLLQALAIGLHGTEDAERLLKSNSLAHIGVELQQGERAVVRNFVRLSNDWIMIDHTCHEISPVANLLAYGPSRLEISSEESTASSMANKNSVYNLLHQRGQLLNIEYWLKMCALDAKSGKSGKQGAKRAERVKKLLVELMPNVTSMELVGSEFKYTEKGHKVSLNNLSSGQTSLLAMVGDMLIRLYDAQPNAVDPKELQGIVLIDELDIHLHPSRQKELPSQLSKIFPNVQFIATTHSVIPLSGAPPGSVFLRVVRDAEEGTQVERLERLEIEVANLLPNAILYSPLFGMESLLSKQNKKLADVYTDDNYEDIQRKKRVDEALKRLAEAGDILPKGFLDSEE